MESFSNKVHVQEMEKKLIRELKQFSCPRSRTRLPRKLIPISCPRSATI